MTQLKEVSAPSVVDGHRLKYHYDRVNVFTPKDLPVDFSQLNPGDQVVLKQAPDNPHDHKAVSVVHPKGDVGFLYRGRLQDMANDYLSAHRPIYAHIDSIDDDERKLTLFLAFYGSTLFAGSKSYKLTSSGNKAAQESIELLGEGDPLSVLYDYEKEKYEVSSTGDVIGYLPKAAEDLAETMDCFVDSIDTDENDKYIVCVRFEELNPQKPSTPVPSSPPPPAPVPKPDPIVERAERALGSSKPAPKPTKPSPPSHRPVSPAVQRSVDLFLTLYPDSKISFSQHLSGEGNYISIHAVQDGKENRFIVQYDSQADAIDCYDTRMNPLSSTRGKPAKKKKGHSFLWILVIAAFVFAALYYLK